MTNGMNGIHSGTIQVPEVEIRPVHNPAPLFDKCRSFTAAEEHRALGFYPYFRCIESAQDTEVVIDGKKMLMLGSNSYLGLTNDPRIKEAVQDAVAKYGSGCAGSRFLNGTLDIHVQLEEQIAEFIGKEAALCFTTGFQTNLGVIAALVGREDAVFIDRTDHASIVDGSRLGFGKVIRFRHNCVDHLEKCLKECNSPGKFIVVDGIYSMEGDIARLDRIVELAQRYKAGIFVDDAHAVGVLGKTGNGTADHFDLTDNVDLIGGTFSKSLASIGGYVAGDYQVIDYLKHHARSLIFSASMAPACVAAVQKALEITVNEPERREALWRNSHFLLNSIQEIGLDTGDSETPIIPVVTGGKEHCLLMWRELHDAGIFVNPVVPPATPSDRCLIRLSVMATHTTDQLEWAIEVIEKIGKKIGLITPRQV